MGARRGGTGGKAEEVRAEMSARRDWIRIPRETRQGRHSVTNGRDEEPKLNVRGAVMWVWVGQVRVGLGRAWRSEDGGGHILGWRVIGGASRAQD